IYSTAPFAAGTPPSPPVPLPGIQRLLMSNTPTFRRLVFPVLSVVLVTVGCAAPPPPGTAGLREYLFCFWNVENLFDDSPNPQAHPADKVYDEWFAHDAAARQLKYQHLSEALVHLQNGKGPDILALAEVESQRSVELLRDALNARLADPALHYSAILYRDPH